MPQREINEMANRIGYKGGNLPFTYLGITIRARMNKTSSWLPLVDKVNNKLSAWRSKCLSIGGWLTLYKSVLGSPGSYLFSIFKVLDMVISKLEYIRGCFF